MVTAVNGKALVLSSRMDAFRAQLRKAREEKLFGTQLLSKMTTIASSEGLSGREVKMVILEEVRRDISGRRPINAHKLSQTFGISDAEAVPYVLDGIEMLGDEESLDGLVLKHAANSAKTLFGIRS
jgi:hypothetical protein